MEGALPKPVTILLTPRPDEPVEHWLLRGLYIKILEHLNSGCYYSRDIAKYTGIPQEIIKPIMRELRLYGLIQFNKGNLNEDGETYGCGHHISESGLKYLRELRKVYSDDIRHPRPTKS